MLCIITYILRRRDKMENNAINQNNEFDLSQLVKRIALENNVSEEKVKEATISWVNTLKHIDNIN